MADYTGGLGEMLIGMANENQRRREKGLGFILEEENQRETRQANKETKNARIESEKRQDKYNADMLDLKNAENTAQYGYQQRMVELKQDELNNGSQYTVAYDKGKPVKMNTRTGETVPIVYDSKFSPAPTNDSKVETKTNKKIIPPKRSEAEIQEKLKAQKLFNDIQTGRKRK